MARKKDVSEETFLEFLIDILVNSAIILAVFFLVQKTIAAPFQVVGDSMKETLFDGEYIVVSKLEYLLGEPQKGDIVVFHPPHNEDEFYIKRVLGIPGDQVQLKAGEVWVNGEKIDEDYLTKGLKTCLVARQKSCSTDDKSYTVPEGKYFVLGDNRDHSSDSRSWYDDENRPDPFVSLDQIQGKTRVVLYPLPGIRIMDNTDAFDNIPLGESLETDADVIAEPAT